MRSLRAMRQPQTPSFTKSPSTCGGKCFVGFLSHSRICSLRSFARARIAVVDIIIRLVNLLIMITHALEIREGSPVRYARKVASPAAKPLLAQQMLTLWVHKSSVLSLLYGRRQHTVQVLIHCGFGIVIGKRLPEQPTSRYIVS